MEKEAPISPQEARIMDLCFYAFNQKGYKAVSMSELARELKISKKTIYKFFGSKEEMLEAALVGLFTRIESKLNVHERQRPVREIFHDYFFIFKEYRQALSPLLRSELRDQLPYLFERVETFERHIMQRSFIRFIKGLRSKKIIEYPSPSREIAAGLFSMFAGLLDMNEDLARFMLGVIQKGLAVRKKKKK